MSLSFFRGCTKKPAVCTLQIVQHFSCMKTCYLQNSVITFFLLNGFSGKLGPGDSVTSVSSGHPRLPAQSLAPVYIRLHRFRLPLAALQTFYHEGNFRRCYVLIQLPRRHVRWGEKTD